MFTCIIFYLALAYKYKSNRYFILTLYPETLIFSLILINSCRFFGIFYIYNHVVCKQWFYFFPSNSSDFYFALLPFCPSQNSRIILNRSVWSGVFVSFSNSRKSFQNFTTNHVCSNCLKIVDTITY